MTFFADHLWNSRVPLELRRAAIGAMFDLYAKLFALHPTEGGTYTWWDLLASNVIEEQRRPRAVAGLPSPWRSNPGRAAGILDLDDSRHL